MDENPFTNSNEWMWPNERPPTPPIADAAVFRCPHCVFHATDVHATRIHLILNHGDTLSAPIPLPMSTFSLQGLQSTTLDHLRLALAVTIAPISPYQANAFQNSPFSQTFPAFPPYHIGYPVSEQSAFVSVPQKHPFISRRDTSLASPITSTTASSVTATMPLTIAETPPESVRCHLCGKLKRRDTHLSYLMNHVKRHCEGKQFVCTDCGYCSSDMSHVRGHMRQRHQIDDRQPINTKNMVLQRQWIQMAVQCFPTLSDKFESYQFKRGHDRKRLRRAAAPASDPSGCPSSSKSSSA